MNQTIQLLNEQELTLTSDNIKAINDIVQEYIHDNIYLVAVNCFQYGIIIGKRAERGKKRDH